MVSVEELQENVYDSAQSMGVTLGDVASNRTLAAEAAIEVNAAIRTMTAGGVSTQMEAGGA